VWAVLELQRAGHLTRRLLSDVTVAKQYFVLGAGKVLIDWVGVENVAHAHVLAEAAVRCPATMPFLSTATVVNCCYVVAGALPRV
jgi:hypothetical protein